MRTPTLLMCSAAFVLAIAGSAAAQRVVRGAVVDSAGDSPVAGAVVTLFGADGASLGRTVTNSRGEFSVSISSPPARGRVVRIGYHPRDVDLPPANTTDAPIRVRMTRLPSLLDAVRVTGSELCPNSAERGGAFALWEQVRAGLLATVVAREADPAIATTLTYQRRENQSDHVVEQQAVVVRSGKTTRPFLAAAPATQLAATGYVASDASGRTLFAPDADVLVDESFAATHCFRLVNADTRHEHQIGLAFSPAPRREKTVDVEGVIWVDANRPALRSLEFRHTGFDDAWTRTPPGGHVEFQTAANGVSFIERWSIDVPILRAIPGVSGTFEPGRITSSRPDQIAVDGLSVSGGSVVSARWRDGSSWAVASTGMSGVVVEQDTNQPVVAAVVSLEGTADTVVTDSLGRFAFATMVPGKYRLEVADTTLDAFARHRRESRVVDVVAGQTTVVRPTLPPIGVTIAQACRSVGSVFRAVLVGEMLGRDTAAVGKGLVRAEWRVNAAGQYFDLSREDAVDPRGRFIVCGLPNDIVIHLQWTSGTAQADTVVVLNPKAVGRLEWRVTPP
jgi:hypothetical protein